MVPAATALPLSIEAVIDLFDVDDTPSVRGYLGDHSYLVPLLAEAHARIPRYFPEPLCVRLQLLPDRDDGDHADLFAIINSGLPEDRALQLLDRFDEDWWLEAAVRGRGRLTIDVEAAA